MICINLSVVYKHFSMLNQKYQCQMLFDLVQSLQSVLHFEFVFVIFEFIIKYVQLQILVYTISVVLN